MSTIDSVIEGTVESAFEISSGLRSRREYLQDQNPSGEDQLRADVWASDLLKRKITRLAGVGEFASEEEEEIIDCGNGVSVTVDPLDGSSNVPTNNIVGTIVGIYEDSLPARGRNLVCSFYIVYGPITTMVVARNGRVDEYALEEDRNGGGVDLYHTEENLTLPSPSIFGFGGRDDRHTDAFQEFARSVRSRLKRRYGGSLVGDANQVLHRGGIFAYPGLKNQPEGKLRLLYEASPISYIFEEADGASSSGDQSILDVPPSNLHERTPLFIGNREFIDEVESLYDRFA